MANIEREQLEKKTVSDLRVIARQLGIKRVDSFKKVDLIDLIHRCHFAPSPFLFFADKKSKPPFYWRF